MTDLKEINIQDTDDNETEGGTNEATIKDADQNLYTEVGKRALDLLNSPTNCAPEMPINKDGPTFNGSCEYITTDVGNRDIETIVKIVGRQIHDGLNFRVLDPETGFQILIYTKSLDQVEVPKGITFMDREIHVEDLRLHTNGAIAAYVDNQPQNPENISIYVVKGDGHLEVEFQGVTIGKIKSPGLEQSAPIHLLEVNRVNHYISKYAKITPEGQLTLTTEDGEPILNTQEFIDEAESTFIETRSNENYQSCSVMNLLNNPQSANSTEVLLVVMALILIQNKLNK